MSIPVDPSCKGLGESRSMALKQFLQLERKLAKNPDQKEKYVDFINQYINSGYMREAGKVNDPNFTYYLPHHAVWKKF